ncbi:hypothetical protein BC567DRAFT_252636 [Phyllosticta citribraziliensis]
MDAAEADEADDDDEAQVQTGQDRRGAPKTSVIPNQMHQQVNNDNDDDSCRRRPIIETSRESSSSSSSSGAIDGIPTHLPPHPWLQQAYPPIARLPHAARVCRAEEPNAEREDGMGGELTRAIGGAELSRRARSKFGGKVVRIRARHAVYDDDDDATGTDEERAREGDRGLGTT